MLDVRTHRLSPLNLFSTRSFSRATNLGGEALKLLRTNSFKIILEERTKHFKAHFLDSPETLKIQYSENLFTSQGSFISVFRIHESNPPVKTKRTQENQLAMARENF